MKKSYLYTRTGDGGDTSLVGGVRVGKDDLRLEAYGTVDELNSWLGLVSALSNPDPETASLLTRIQNKMFNIGAWLATAGLTEADGVDGLADTDIDQLEHAIDRLDSQVPPLNRFVLPAGNMAATVTNVARTVCRRCERRLVALSRQAYVDPLLLRYINRLSDLLFVFARFNNIDGQVDEIFWDKNC